MSSALYGGISAVLYLINFCSVEQRKVRTGPHTTTCMPLRNDRATSYLDSRHLSELTRKLPCVIMCLILISIVKQLYD